MVTTVLLTLGRLPKALDLARGFAARGCRVLIAEPYRWHLARVSRDVAASVMVTAPNVSRARYLADLRAVIEREQVDLVVPVSEEALHAVHLGPQLPAGVRLFCPPAALLTELHDKQRFVARAAAAGLAVPETHRLGTAEAAAMAERIDTITKPVLTCSGKGFARHRRGGGLPAPDPAVPVIVQAQVPGRVYSSFSLARAGQLLTTLVYTGVVYSGTVAVCFRRVDDQPALVEWVRRFVEAVGVDGFISFDFIVTPEGEPTAIECNPRITSGIHFLEPADLALAILDPDQAAPAIRLKPDRLMQQFYPCLTEVQNSVRTPQFRDNLAALLAARDVTWAVRDPLPFVLMPLTSLVILWRAWRERKTLGEVATDDIAWFGDSG